MLPPVRGRAGARASSALLVDRQYCWKQKRALARRLGHRALYFYAPKRFRALTIAQADGSMPALLKKLAKARLLVVDDWGMAKLDARQYRDFLELIDDRHGCGSTLITSQFAVEQWHALMPDPTVADAILDRLVHTRHTASRSAAKHAAFPSPNAECMPLGCR